MTQVFPPPAPESATPAPEAADLSAAFSHVGTWIFDLDNTLYSSEAKLWPQVDERITLFLQDLFGIDGLSARALQKYYYHTYGTTLKGLMDEHAIEPADFLDFAHRIDLSLLDPDPRLGRAIEALPGRKLILTNGSQQHAENVSRKLGIRDHFEAIFDIVAADFVPKPEARTYEKFLALHGIDPAGAAMFEDLEKNLAVPHRLGMTTVLVLPRNWDPFREAHEQMSVEAAHIDYSTTDLAGFLESLMPIDRRALLKAVR